MSRAWGFSWGGGRAGCMQSPDVRAYGSFLFLLLVFPSTAPTKITYIVCAWGSKGFLRGEVWNSCPKP